MLQDKNANQSRYDDQLHETIATAGGRKRTKIYTVESKVHPRTKE